MVIDVTHKSLTDVIRESNAEINDIVNEFKYNNLLEKYNYLKENGVLLELNMSNIKEKILSFVQKIIDKVKRLWETVKTKVERIIYKMKERKQERVYNKAIKRFDRTFNLFNFTIKALNKIFGQASNSSNAFNEEDYDEFVKDSNNLYSDFSAECENMANDMQDFFRSMM